MEIVIKLKSIEDAEMLFKAIEKHEGFDIQTEYPQVKHIDIVGSNKDELIIECGKSRRSVRPLRL